MRVTRLMERSVYLGGVGATTGSLICVVPVNSGLPVLSLMEVAMAMAGWLRAGAPATVMRSPGFNESRAHPRRIKVVGLGSSKLQFTVCPFASVTST